ncbi:MAG: hypothetical protein RQ839_05140 [Thermoproteus sp.]|jgi:uncharacterized protein GlcG (DUF336 family)|nr:hypothetical protein [Thermoproteus sp.]MDT7881542.1 hypothetical protein [Thermoproteus sp.]
MKVLDAIRLGVEKAEAMGICVAMAVVDLRGEVVVMGARTPPKWRMKAGAAATFRRSTAELAERAGRDLTLYLGFAIYANPTFGI